MCVYVVIKAYTLSNWHPEPCFFQVSCRHRGAEPHAYVYHTQMTGLQDMVGKCRGMSQILGRLLISDILNPSNLKVNSTDF